MTHPWIGMHVTGVFEVNNWARGYIIAIGCTSDADGDGVFWASIWLERTFQGRHIQTVPLSTIRPTSVDDAAARIGANPRRFE